MLKTDVFKKSCRWFIVKRNLYLRTSCGDQNVINGKVFTAISAGWQHSYPGYKFIDGRGHYKIETIFSKLISKEVTGISNCISCISKLNLPGFVLQSQHKNRKCVVRTAGTGFVNINDSYRKSIICPGT